MVNETKSNKIWSITLVRDYKSDMSDDIEIAMFVYGRTADEIDDECRKSLRIPNGLTHLLKTSHLTKEALETGFCVEISRNPQNSDDWVQFTATVHVQRKEPPCPFTQTRVLYVAQFPDATFEMVDLSGPCSEQKMPQKLWLRAVELSYRQLAWVLNQNFLSSEKYEQKTLDEWFNFGDTEDSKCQFTRPKSLILPGPVDKVQPFFESQL